jgi:hypothetical protein
MLLDVVTRNEEKTKLRPTANYSEIVKCHSFFANVCIRCDDYMV